MRSRKDLRPRIESLETKTVMSAGVSTSLAAALAAKREPGPVVPTASSPTGATDVVSAQTKTVNLSGQVAGTYTTTQGPPDTGTQYRIKASGSITPIGLATVSGSFRTLGFINGGVETGTLTIVGPHGKLTLKLTKTINPAAAGASRDYGSTINPGGPMIPSSTPATRLTVNPPIILIYAFDYHIIRGTGQYSHLKGAGIVHVETTPGLSSPIGPGIYNSAALNLAGTGRVTLTF
jgi:hypothetical protein